MMRPSDFLGVVLLAVVTASILMGLLAMMGMNSVQP